MPTFRYLNPILNSKNMFFCVVNAYMDTPKSRLTRHIRTGLGINKFYRDEFKHIFRVDDNIFMRASERP